MEGFEAYLKSATAKGTNILPGAVMAVVDKDGNYIYKHVAGYNGVSEDAPPLEFDQTFFIASCTKLLTSIASLQLVERHIFQLDDAVDDLLPELARQPIIYRKEDGTFELRPAKKSITLRHLLTHSSGATYDWADANLIGWRISGGEAPDLVEDGDVAKGYAYPRAYEAGDSWAYSGGLDWASLLVERLTKRSFEDYVEENIAKHLGITSFTTRKDDGTFTEGPTLFWPDPVGEGGGAGCYSSVQDYTRVLSDLLKETTTLLSKHTVDELFSPQFKEGSLALAGLRANGEYSYKPTLDDSLEGVTANHGLGGFLVTEDLQRANYFRPKGTLSWSGLPSLSWGVNRERGLAFFFATQVVPWPDRKSLEVAARFETVAWRDLKA